MSSLRFTHPIYLKGLSEKSAKEWVGLEVGLASAFPTAIGYIGEVPARVWSEETKTYQHGTHCDPHRLSDQLSDEFFFVSREALVHACKQQLSARRHLLGWLTQNDHFEHFAVRQSMAEYLP
jgi:hypothetical protein